MEEWHRLQHNLECELRYHVILTTANLRSLDDDEELVIKGCLKEPLGRQGCDIHDFQISEDHVHLLIATPTIICIEEVVRDIKEDTSLQISLATNKGFECLVWSQDYFVSALGEKESFNLETWHLTSEVTKRRRLATKQ